MTVDPQEVVDGVARRAHDLAATEPPALLRRPIEPPPPLPPVRQSDEVQALHRGWEALAAGTAGAARPSGVGGKVRSRVASVAADLGLAGPQPDRALLGDLIRAVDAVAARADQLADRLAAVEAVLPELVTALGEDLVRLRAALGSAGAALGSGGEGPPASTTASDDPTGG